MYVAIASHSPFHICNCRTCVCLSLVYGEMLNWMWIKSAAVKSRARSRRCHLCQAVWWTESPSRSRWYKRRQEGGGEERWWRWVSCCVWVWKRLSLNHWMKLLSITSRWICHTQFHFTFAWIESCVLPFSHIGPTLNASLWKPTRVGRSRFCVFHARLTTPSLKCAKCMSGFLWLTFMW